MTSHDRVWSGGVRRLIGTGPTVRGRETTVPVIRELDPSAGPLEFFGGELRRARVATKLSQEQLGQRLGYSGALVGKVEMGERAPAPEFAEGCDQDGRNPPFRGRDTRFCAAGEFKYAGIPAYSRVTRLGELKRKN